MEIVDFTMILKALTLMNKPGTNMCWWNSFIQLFTSTRGKLIVNEMYKFINAHECNDKNVKNHKCWYCDVFQTTILLMIENNNPNVGDFPKILFEVPQPIIDPKDNNKFIFHPFHEFKLHKYRQQDSFEGCDQWFD